MKTFLPIFCLLALPTGIFAQITITNATFPVAGDTLRMAVDNTPGTIGSLTPPGPQTWDFTGLSAESTYHIVYRQASTGSVGNQLPGAELVASLSPGTETYYNVTNTRFERQAYYGILPYDLVANNIFDYYPPIPERRAPLNFFDINGTSSGFLEYFVPANFPPLLMLQLAAKTNNASIDSMRYRLATNSIEAVDAYGMMHIPGGSFEVLREKSTQYTETRIDGKIPPLGWLDITDNAILAGFYGLGVDTSVTYTFYNNLSKEPIAIVSLDKNQAYATKIVYKNTAPPMVSVSEEVMQKPGVRITPNPVSNEAVLVFENLIPAEYRMLVFDQLGRVVITRSERMESRHSTQLELSGLPGGVFLFQLMDDKGRVICWDRLVKKG